ncbi:MAG: hypothetical protein FJX68_11770 [Alphaproteobacteria bacterium]|nr:hypothetical protein [Alphaproteobacteria bacterium]
MSSFSSPIRRIMVALDAHAWDLDALEQVAELALELHAELAGLFVEDINLFRLCELPGGEVSLASGSLRRPEREAMERDLRGQAEMARRTLERVAVQRRLAWSFRVTRGRTEETVLGAAGEADLVALARRHRGFRQAASHERVGRQRQAVAAHYRGGEGAKRVLDVALRAAARTGGRLLVLLPDDDPAAAGRLEAEIAAVLASSAIGFEILRFGPSVKGLAAALEQTRARLLVLEASVARAIEAVMPEVAVDLLLVREPDRQPASNSAT